MTEQNNKEILTIQGIFELRDKLAAGFSPTAGEVLILNNTIEVLSAMFPLMVDAVGRLGISAPELLEDK